MDKEEVEAISAHSALIFDLDNLVLDARNLYYEVLAEMLQTKGATLTPILFSRYVIAAGHADLAALFAALKLDEDADAATEQWQNTTQGRIATSSAKIPEGLKIWMDAASARGAAVCAASTLPQPKVEAIFSRLGLSPETIRLYACNPAERCLQDAETWVRIAASLSKSTRRCVAIVTAADTAKAALAAQMSVVAIPDVYTEFQDFCGADIVTPRLKDVKPDEYFKTIHF